MTQENYTMSTWRRLSTKPTGKWVFSRLVCWKAPYFASIRPRFQVLRPGYCVVTIRKRRAVQNHIGTVHAIAMCNMAELAAGTMTDVTVPGGFRWIPKGMTVEYKARAETDLTAIAEIEPLPEFEGSMELPVSVRVTDTQDKTVFSAVITMWISKKEPRGSKKRAT